MVLGMGHQLKMLPSDLQVEYLNLLTKQCKLHVYSVTWQRLLSVSLSFVT